MATSDSDEPRRPAAVSNRPSSDPEPEVRSQQESQPQWKPQEASKLNNRLRLAEIITVAIEAKHVNSAEGEEAELTYNSEKRTARWGFLEGSVRAVFPCVVEIQQRLSSDNRKALAKIEVAIRVDYSAIGELSSDEFAVVDHFVAIVGWSHVWPYIRSEIQSLSTKLGFPPLTLPVLLVGSTANLRVERLPDDSRRGAQGEPVTA